jgi:aryl-alcohol dehydrogenase-like predicted oxidoreductase
MERRTPGRTGLPVSILGFGGAEIGYGHAAQATVDRLLGEALDAGLNVIDTAACYLDSETLIGQAVGHRRQDYSLLTTCGHASGLDLPNWDPRLLTAAIERSLQRLRTDHLDVVQLHSPPADVLRRGEVVDALQCAREAGKTRYLGYSGDGEAAREAITCGAFDTLQTSVNLADQEAIEWTLPLASARGLGVIAKRPGRCAGARHYSTTVQAHGQIPVSGGTAPRVARRVLRHFAGQCEAIRQVLLGRI